MKSAIIVWIALLALTLASCSGPRLVAVDSADEGKDLLNLPALQTAHTGICILDVGTGKYLYNYQGEKYFVPASNTKLFTLFAAMKYLRDSLPGIRYNESADSIIIYPTGDPTFLHPDFKNQPVVEKLQKSNKTLVLNNDAWKEEALGEGWSWDDYNDYYMAERSPLPVYGNVIKWVQVAQKNTQPELEDSLQTFVFSEPEVNWKVRFKEDRVNKTFSVHRKRDENYFEISQGREARKEAFIPFVTNGVLSAIELLKDTLQKEILIGTGVRVLKPSTIYSQPVDTVFKKMIYPSDNFMAEQLLLMVSNEKLGVMNDRQIIDTLLGSDLSGLPQKPSWVDGSGLSRFNLFTPEDFVWLLNKMKDEFGIERMKAILPGGGQGTLRNYYVKDSGYIFAKTGSLTGELALSGYLVTSHNKLLIFSVMVNNHEGSATPIRRGVEQFLEMIRSKY